MFGPSLVNRKITPAKNYPYLLEYNFERLLTGNLTSYLANQTVTTTGPQFNATVTAFDNSFLSTPAKVDLAGASDIVGDRAGILRIIGLNQAGAYAYEDLALNAGNSSTAVQSVNTYSKVFILQNRHSGAWTTGADITCKATGTANVICTLPASTTRYGKVSSALAIPRHYGTFAGTGGGSYVTNKGWFLSVSAVYNITDDPTRVTNLWAGTAFDQAEDLTGVLSQIIDGFAPGTQNVYLTTGTGGSKLYEVQGVYQPFQNILDGSETVEVLYRSPLIYVFTSGTGVPSGAGTVYSSYVPLSVKFPLGNTYDEASMVRTAVDFGGVTEPTGAETAFKPSYVAAYDNTKARPYAGQTLTFGTAARRRGLSAANDGSLSTSLAGVNLASSIEHMTVHPMLAKVTALGTNTSLNLNEIILLCLCRSEASGQSWADGNVAGYRLSQTTLV